MTTSSRTRARLAAIGAAAAVATTVSAPHPSPVSAHGDIEVGPYALTIGFIDEPAYQGEPNGLDLAVMRHGAGDAAAGAAAADDHADAAGDAADDHGHDAPASESAPAGPVPVEGLEETLQAEIIFGAESRTLAIAPQWGEPGKYTAPILPTAAGDYTWRVFGTIDGTPVDVKLSSGPDTFGAVETKDAVAFPAAEPDVAAVKAEVDTAARTASDAAGSARSALLAGIAGAVLGALGMATAAVALRSRSR